jgi:NAD(P)H dehydrogenase (quinone)
MRFVIIGAGPAGNQAASHAARLGLDVVLIERDVIGGSANLRDCIPSKTMIATGGALSALGRMAGMGLSDAEARLDVSALAERVTDIENRLEAATTELLLRQGVELVRGTARLDGPHVVVARTGETERTYEADAVLIATGSRPRVPEWAHLDGERVLTTRDAYPPKELPTHLAVIGSGVTGVEFVHMFSSLGSEVTLIVSRQHVLPQKDPEVAAALEENFINRGVRLLKGARAESVTRTGSGVRVTCNDGRVVEASHALFAVGSIPNTEDLNLHSAGLEVDAGGYLAINHHCQTDVGHVYAAGDASGKLLLSSVAAMQGRKIAEHVAIGHTVAHRHLNYNRAPSAVFTEPEIADVGIAEAEAFADGRKIRVTKVPFASTAKALIENDPRGFVKIVSDPATGVVLGGSIVGQSAAELISVIALAVTAELRVADIADSMFVHPTLAEALAEAAE